MFLTALLHTPAPPWAPKHQSPPQCSSTVQPLIRLARCSWLSPEQFCGLTPIDLDFCQFLFCSTCPLALCSFPIFYFLFIFYSAAFFLSPFKLSTFAVREEVYLGSSRSRCGWVSFSLILRALLSSSSRSTVRPCRESLIALCKLSHTRSLGSASCSSFTPFN